MLKLFYFLVIIAPYLLPTAVCIYTNKLAIYCLYLVQFLSMKLASVNPMFYDLATDLDTLLVRPEVRQKTQL